MGFSPRRGLSLNPKGFTLIELMVSVALVGILAAIAIQSFMGYRQRAFDARAMHDLGNAAVAQEAYYATYQTYVDVPTTLGPAQLDAPGLVLSAWVELSIVAEDDHFVARATSPRGTGRVFEYDSDLDTIVAD